MRHEGQRSSGLGTDGAPRFRSPKDWGAFRHEEPWLIRRKRDG